MKINLASTIQTRLTEFLDTQMHNGKLSIGNHMYISELLNDDDSYSDWLNQNWNTIKELDMLIVRDFLTWSFLLDTQASSPINLEYYFNSSI
jgi:hypothetical protein